MSHVEKPRLKRQLGMGGAVMMGLGAMIGTGVFVSTGLVAGIAGPAVIQAVALAAGVAICNALSSAQLAAAHPVSGGSYEYGYRYLNPWLGFTAGWMFLVAKSMSAATAALGMAGYLLHALGQPLAYRVPLAVGASLVLTLVVWGGIQRSSKANIAIVSITLLALAVFIIAGAPVISVRNLAPLFPAGTKAEAALGALLHATALMFVAYTGYARIATLGEEVHDPRRAIPRAIIITTLITMGLYMGVALVGVGVLGAKGLQEATTAEAAPLAVAAQRFPFAPADVVLTVGAITAMLGVLLNLILGLSRVLLAMGRRGDMPAAFGRLNESRTTPTWAVPVVGAAIAALATIGDVKTTWSFSAFSVLLYYAITNLAALRLSSAERLYPRGLAVSGLLGCLFLAFWVEPRTWLVGLALIAAGLLWHAVARRWQRNV